MPEVWSPAALVLLGSLIAIVGAFWSSRQQAVFERELRQQAEETLGQVSGGDSYCYVVIGGAADFVLQHVGRFPMFDVHVVIRGSEDGYDLENFSVSEFLGRGTHYKRSILYKGRGEHLGPWNGAEDLEEERLTVRISARNGLIEQTLYLKPRSSGPPKQAWRVERGDVVLAESPDPIPMLESGRPDWARIE